MASNYFSRFDNFTPDPDADLVSEFDRLALDQNWGRTGQVYRHQRQVCFVTAYNQHFSQGFRTLAGWQNLCREVFINPIPGSITKCRKALSKVNVNIIDLIEFRARGIEPEIFPTRSALRNYSLRTGKIFKKQMAKDDGYLSALLIRMF